MPKSFVHAFLAALALVLAGCASHPNGVLLPVSGAATVPGTSRVDMLVATTRLRSANPALMFTGERAETLSLAEISVSIPPDAVRQIGEVQWPARLPGNPATDFVTVGSRDLQLPEAYASLKRQMAERRTNRIMVFVHGYNTTFEDAVYRFAQIVHDSRAPAVPVLFTWPSRGRTLAYPYDRESANYSRDELEAVLRALDREKQVGEIVLLAHSMGNVVALEALRQMAIRDRKIIPKLKIVMLAAPDVDTEVFRTQIAQMQGGRPSFTLFVSRDDVALSVSRRFWGDTVRLGAVDPDVEPYKGLLEREKITVIDLTRLKAGDRLNHSKFAESPDVVRFIGQRFVDGQDVGGKAPSMGEKVGLAAASAAATVGSAAGMVVTAPIAVIDPASRRAVQDRMEEMGMSADGVKPGVPVVPPSD